jgi:hypothetical protein
VTLIGAIIILIYGFLSLIGSAFLIFSPIEFLGGVVGGIIQLIIGAICLIGSKQVSKLVWAIILLILGIIAGSIGGSLVVLGALLGLVAYFLKSTA